MRSADGQLPLPLDYAPAVLRGHGYRDAHSYPLVSPDVGKVRRSYRQPPSAAWDYPRLELRTGNTHPVITIDCDGRVSVERVVEFILDEGRPPPNVVVLRKASGNVHAHYFLATPVHYGKQARQRPLLMLARVAEYLRAALAGDPNYRGVLTLNPCWEGPEFETFWLRCWPWELRELRAFIPAGWKRPRVATTGIGRNVDLFRWAVKEAHRPRVAEMLLQHGEACPTWLEIVATKNEETWARALPASEVRSIAHSAGRYSRLQYSRERFQEIQRVRARKPRPKRYEGSNEQRRPWALEGVSRATWYRRRTGETANHNR